MKDTFSFLDQLLEHYHQNESNRLINGYLGLIKSLVQFLGTNMKDSSINTPQSTNTNKSPDVNDQHLPIGIRQIIEVNTERLDYEMFSSSSSVLISSVISVYNMPIIMLYLVH